VSSTIRSAIPTAYCLLGHCHAVCHMLCCTAPVWLMLHTAHVSIRPGPQFPTSCSQTASQIRPTDHPVCVSSLSTGCILTHGQTAICWACRLSQGSTRTQGRLRPGSQADAASVRSWCLCRGPMQQQRRMMATCWAWSMMPLSTKASSL